MQIQELKTAEDREVGYCLLRQLRTELSFSEFNELRSEANLRDHYTLIGAFEDNQCLGVMGYRILFDFVHGKHLYVDDLVVSPLSRSQGIGASLLGHAEKIAEENKCRGLRLSTGLENERGRRFYEKEGWVLRSVSYKKVFDK
jgi:ribosomal protein S18 acetylase RimI-like enzyme